MPVSASVGAEGIAEMTHVASEEHLLRNVFNASLIFALRSLRPHRVHILQISRQELDVAAIGETCILIVVYLERCIKFRIAVLRQERVPKVGGVGNVRDLVQLLRNVNFG